MPRWTRDASLGVLPRAGPYVTPAGYCVAPALLWHLAVERAQHHGIASLTDLLRLVGVPRDATRIERTRVMRLLTAGDMLWLCDEVERRIAKRRRARGNFRARHPLDGSRMVATRPSEIAQKSIPPQVPGIG